MKNELTSIYSMTNKNEKLIEQRKRYAAFLKRKRIENQVTLEYLAEGICATSYLSRIENGVVDVSDDYFNILFNKLNIDYKTLKETKDIEIFDLLYKCYLNKDDNIALDLINDALKTNFYVELEYDLMVLFNNINQKLYSEAANQIINLSKRVDNFTQEELLFFIFLCALYGYKTCQGLYAYQQISVLCEENIAHLNAKYALYDLALDILCFTGKREEYLCFYQGLMNDENYLLNYNKSSLKHKAQLMYLSNGYNKDKIRTNLDNIKIDLGEKYKEEIDWLIIMNEYRFCNPNDYLTYLRSFEPTAKIVALEAMFMLSLNIKDQNVFFERKQKVLSFDQNLIYFKIIETIEWIMRGDNDYHAMFLLKHLMNELLYDACDVFFVNIIKLLYICFGSKIHRYKEVIQEITDIEKQTCHIDFNF